MGRNLLDTSAPDGIYFSSNVEQMEAAPAYRRQAERRTDARNLLRLVYFGKVLR